MTKRPSRLPLTVPATALTFLALTFNPSTTNPSEPQPQKPTPDPTQIRSLHRLARWVAGTTPLSALRPADLDAALGHTENAFELFDREARREDAAERRVLAALPYGEAIAEAAHRNQIDGLLLAAIVETESRFSPRAVSPRGAKGLMQVMPSSCDRREAAALFDPHVNLAVGSRYLASLLDLYDGDLELALAAYNAGPATVARYRGVPPYRETRTYVRRVLGRYLAHYQSLQVPDAPARTQVAARIRSTAPALRPKAEHRRRPAFPAMDRAPERSFSLAR